METGFMENTVITVKLLHCPKCKIQYIEDPHGDKVVSIRVNKAGEERDRGLGWLEVQK